MESVAGIFARESAYLERYVQIGVAGNRVISVSFPQEPPAEAGREHTVLDAIERYLDGVVERFDDVELALTVDTDTRAVLDVVRELPYGTERDLDTIVATTPGLDATEAADVETARRALSANPVPILIPDHRVSDGPAGGPGEVRRQCRALEGL